MNTYKVLLTAIFLFVNSVVYGQMLQPRAQTQTTNDSRLTSAHQAASASIAAFRGDDFKAYVKLIHPAAIEDAGGREKMIQITRHGKVALDEQTKGYDASVRMPTRVIEGTREIYTVVPQTVSLRLENSETFDRQSYLLGVSENNGRSWTFIDGGTEAAKIREMLPGFPQSERLPNEPRR